MATATLTTRDDAERRVLPFAAPVIPHDLGLQLQRQATAHLDAATFTLEVLNAADAPMMDLEPDADGEPDAIEASAQPVTLCPDRVRPVVQHRPTRAQMREAYRRNGDPIPANLRGLFGRAFA